MAAESEKKIGIKQTEKINSTKNPKGGKKARLQAKNNLYEKEKNPVNIGQIRKSKSRISLKSPLKQKKGIIR